VVLGVDLDVDDSVDHRGDVGEDAPGGPAGLAEGGGELDEGGTLARGSAQLRRAEASFRVLTAHLLRLPPCSVRSLPRGAAFRARQGFPQAAPVAGFPSVK
jgi:hypothetical protein